jgi:predicted small lipoprotein YifL
MPKLFFSVVMICLSCGVFSGCGTKGPLYIPEQRYPQKAPESNIDADSKPALQTPVKE